MKGFAFTSGAVGLVHGAHQGGRRIPLQAVCRGRWCSSEPPLLVVYLRLVKSCSNQTRDPDIRLSGGPFFRVPINPFAGAQPYFDAI